MLHQSYKNYYFLLGIFIVVSVWLIISAIFIYPIPGSDAISFVPASVNFAHGKGLINPIYHLACITDPKGLCRYCFHLPLYPWSVGLISSLCPSTPMAFLVSAFFSIICLFIVFREGWNILKQGTSLFTVGILSLIIISVGLYKIPTNGRPELLSTLFILLVWIFSRKPDSTKNWVLMGFLSGLLMSTQAVGYIITVIFLLLNRVCKGYKFKELIRFSFIFFITSWGVFLIVMSISPNGLNDSLHGIVNHWMSVQKDRADSSVLLIVKYWFFDPDNFMFGLVFITAGILFLNHMLSLRKRLSLINQWLLVLGFLIILLALYIFSIKSAPTVYNISQFYPVICLYILQRSLTWYKLPQRAVINVFLFGMFFSTLIYQSRNIYLFLDYITGGKTFFEAKVQLKKQQMTQKQIVLSWQLWCLTDDYSRIKIWDGLNSEKGDWVIYQQARNDLPEDLIQHGTLKFDWRSGDKKKIGPFVISNRPQDYSFSIWEYLGH